MGEIRDASDAIVKGFGIQSYLETDLLVTDLQSPEFTRGKWSVLYFKRKEVLESYLALKASRGALEAKGAYSPRARQEISRSFMALLSYPQSAIEEKLRSAGKEDPFLLFAED